jgi:hypothetical protein
MFSTARVSQFSRNERSLIAEATHGHISRARRSVSCWNTGFAVTAADRINFMVGGGHKDSFKKPIARLDNEVP